MSSNLFLEIGSLDNKELALNKWGWSMSCRDFSVFISLAFGFTNTSKPGFFLRFRESGAGPHLAQWALYWSVCLPACCCIWNKMLILGLLGLFLTIPCILPPWGPRFSFKDLSASLFHSSQALWYGWTRLESDWLRLINSTPLDIMNKAVTPFSTRGM